MDFDNSLEIITPTKSTSLTINGTGALFIPSGTVGERPVAPQSGYIRFNTTDTVLEYYNGVAVQWQTFGSSTLNSLLSVSGTGMLVQTSPGVYAARTITGTTNRVTVTNGDGVAGNPTLDIASTYVGQSSITTLGTIGTGVWQGTTVGATFGGTGQTVYAVGDILYANTTTTLAKLADVATGNALISGGINTAPSWGKIGLATHVSGTLGVANGGTGTTTTPTNGQLLIGNGTTYTVATLGSGTGISTTTGSGTLTINNTGVTSNIAGTGISVSSATGAVTITNTGVTSVALALPSIFTVSGSPVTTTGTLTGTLNTQAANTVFAGPTTGTAVPTFRTLAIDELSDVVAPTPTIGQFLLFDGTNWVPYGGAGQGGGLRIWGSNIASQSGTSTITPGTTPPTTAQGTLIGTQTITPLSTSSKFVLQVSLSVSASTNNNVHTCAVFRGTTYIGGAIQTFASGGNSNAISITLTDIPATGSPITYTIRYGTNANTWYINRRVAENTYGGVQSGWTIQEY